MPVPSDWCQRLREFVKTKTTWDPTQWDKQFDKFVLTEQAASWDDFLVWLNELQGSWCFRGQREAWWLLDTSLDLAVKKEYSFRDSSGYDHCGYYHLDRKDETRELLSRFQEQAHQYLSPLPSSDDLSSWFAVMRHHGVPTRLLDWTKSPHVAMYFAVEEEAQGQPQGQEKSCAEEEPEPKEKSSAVWAIDLDWLETKERELLGSEASTPESGDPQARAEYLNGLLRQEEKDVDVIVQVNALGIDDRMAAQQGLFLCKLYHQASFSLILMSMMIHPETPDRPVLRKLEVKRDLRIKFLKNLRAMNIHRALLFPGLDGFGQSLRLDLEIKVKEAEW